MDSELNGYRGDIPEYRRIPQRLVYFNIVHGWEPLIFADESMHFLNEPRALPTAIREVEELSRDQSGALFLALPPEIQVTLSQMTRFNAEVRSQITAASLVGVVDAVRTRILDWSLELEQLGIHGDGLSFNEREKTIAHENPAVLNIYGHFAGVFGSTMCPVTVNATQSQTTNQTAARVGKLAALLREGATSAVGQDAAHVNDVAQDLEEVAASEPLDRNRLERVLRSARAFVPKLLGWGARAVAEAEISHLLGA